MRLKEWMPWWLGCLALVFALVPREARATTQVLRVIEESSAGSRYGEVARGVLSFAPGELFDPNDLAIYAKIGPNYQEIPAQVQPIGRSHLDGSIHHALVILENVSEDTESIGGATTRRYAATVFPQRCVSSGVCPPSPSAPVQVTCWNGPNITPCNPGGFTQVCVNSGGLSGALEACFSTSNFQLPNHASIGGAPVINGGASLSLQAHREDAATLAPPPTATGIPNTAGFGYDNNDLPAAGVGHAGTIGPSTNFSADLSGAVSILVEEAGPIRAVLRVSKGHSAGGGFGFVARIYFYHQQPYFRVAYSLLNEEETRCNNGLSYTAYKHVERFAYTLGLPVSGSPAITPPSSPEEMPRPVLAVRYAPGTRNPLPRDPSTIAPGDAPNTSTGWIRAQSTTPGAAWSVAVAHRYFEQVGPKRLQYNGSLVSDLLYVPVAPRTAGEIKAARRQTALAGGHSRTYEFVVELGANGSPVRTGAALRAIAARELFVAQEPTERETRERYNLFTADSTNTALADRNALRVYHNNGRFVEDYSDLTVDASQRPAWFAGDQGFGANGWGSQEDNSTYQQGQYGPAVSAMMRFRASGVARDLRQAEDMMRFAMDSSVVAWASSTPVFGCGTLTRVPGAREPRGGGWIKDGAAFAHPVFTYTDAISNMYLYTNDLASYYFLTGDRRVVDLLSAIPKWPEFLNPSITPGRGAYNREFFAPFVAFLDAWEVIGRNDVFPNFLPAPASVNYFEAPRRVAPTTSTSDALSLNDAKTFMQGIQRMHVAAVRTTSPGSCGHLCVMRTDSTYLPSLVPNRYAPWCAGGSCGAFPLVMTSTCDASGLKTTAGLCVDDQSPNTTGSLHTPWMMHHATEALFRYWRATRDPVDLNRVRELVAHLHEFRSPFGMFLESPLHRDLRYQSAMDHVAGSSAFLQIMEQESGMSLSFTRLKEACPSVDFRLAFRQRPRFEKLGFDVDLYPFLYAWRTSGTTDSVATCATPMISARVSNYLSTYGVTGNSDPDLSSPTINPRTVYWHILGGIPLQYTSSYSFTSTVPTWDTTPGAPPPAALVSQGINDLFGQALYARIRLTSPTNLLRSCPNPGVPSSYECGVLHQTNRQLSGSPYLRLYAYPSPAPPSHVNPENDGLPSTADPAGVRDAVARYVQLYVTTTPPCAAPNLPWRTTNCPP